MNYLEMLKEKCNLTDDFMNIIYQIFDKLISFGYITKRQLKNLEKKLYNNIDVVILGANTSVDYKSGYYDAIKKELYIKDISNLESVYLRIIYILTTTETSKSIYSVGYSTAEMSKMNYKIIHKNFALNRAVVSNLVCRLLYTLPSTLSIVPTYRTYQNDFLGNKITSDNDIYFLEGKLLSQLCYILNVSEENLYINLFIAPQKYLVKFFNRGKFKEYLDFLELFDKTSRTYSNYNKLIYLNRLLNDNYISIRKRINKDNSSLLKEQERINDAIRKSLSRFLNNDEDEENELYTNIESSLSEKINELEENTINFISDIQNTFVGLLLSAENKYSTIEYVVKLKELDKLLIMKNEDLKESIYLTISQKLLNTFETTSNNLIEKMKYSIINEILSNDKYIKIYKNMMFKKLDGIQLEHGSSLMAVTVDDTFMQLVNVNSLDEQMRNLANNTETVRLNSLAYLLNNPSASKDIAQIEMIFTCIRNKFDEFSNIRIEKMFMGNAYGNTFIIIDNGEQFSILQIESKDKQISCKKVKLSENYSIFNLENNSSLPVLYNKQQNVLKSILSFFAIFS